MIVRLRTCEICGGQFTATRNDARYCGRRCRNRAATARRRPDGPCWAQARDTDTGQFAVQLSVAVGERFGRGVVIDPDMRIEGQRRAARLRCDCGVEYIALLSPLRGGEIKSCGCLRLDILTAGRAQGQDAWRTHGLSQKHPLYGTWNAMIWRCEHSSHKAYARYGGRGITVCERWHDFTAFAADIEAEIGPRPAAKYPSGRWFYTLDRVDNNGHYESGNVRWATQVQQVRNRG